MKTLTITHAQMLEALDDPDLVLTTRDWVEYGGDDTLATCAVCAMAAILRSRLTRPSTLKPDTIYTILEAARNEDDLKLIDASGIDEDDPRLQDDEEVFLDTIFEEAELAFQFDPLGALSYVYESAVAYDRNAGEQQGRADDDDASDRYGLLQTKQFILLRLRADAAFEISIPEGLEVRP